MKSWWQHITDGFKSIAEGFATFNIFPQPLKDRLEELDLPKTDEEAFERDRKALESDRKKLFGE